MLLISKQDCFQEISDLEGFLNQCDDVLRLDLSGISFTGAARLLSESQRLSTVLLTALLPALRWERCRKDTGSETSTKSGGECRSEGKRGGFKIHPILHCVEVSESNYSPAEILLFNTNSIKKDFNEEGRKNRRLGNFHQINVFYWVFVAT